MAELVLECFHTQAYNVIPLTFPKLAEGYENWLGDGYYFWQDEYFSKWWGENKKCRGNLSRMYTVYKGELKFDDEEFIDTVFNIEDYYQFVHSIERFAKKHQKNLGRKPTLEEFNEFIEDHNIWQDIKVIRFQDVPENDEHVEVLGFYYKKRIQIRVNDATIINKFVFYKSLACI